MGCTIIKQSGSEIISDNYRTLDDVKEEDFNSSLWIELNTDNRDETVSQLVKFGLNEVITEKLRNPAKIFAFRFSKNP